MGKKFNPVLYVVTDRAWLNGGRLVDQVEQAILGGATMVQLREKSLPAGAFIQAAAEIKRVTERYGIPLIINDRLDVALAVDAAGLHAGQSDLPAAMARRLLGRGKILGISVTNLREALQAETDGADYLGAGAVFPTGTKNDAAYVDFPALLEITRKVSIPVVAIGGINAANALLLKNSGIRGIAVVSAIFAQDNPAAAARTMRRLADELVAAATDER